MQKDRQDVEKNAYLEEYYSILDQYQKNNDCEFNKRKLSGWLYRVF